MAAPTPDLTAYFGSISPYLTTQLQSQERMVSALKRLEYHDHASRRDTGVVLHAIQAELARVAQAMIAVRTPSTFEAANGAQVTALQQSASAAGELGDALTGDPASRFERINRALALAREAEVSTRESVKSIGAALGATATLAAHSVPVIGQIIAAILMAIAAIIVLVATVLEKARDPGRSAPGRHRPDGL